MLKPYILEKTRNSPQVELDKEKSIFLLSGRSIIEDATMFFRPIIEWVESYIQDPNPYTEINLNFDYLNSASIKNVLKVLIEFEKLVEKKKDVKVIWHFEKNDEIMEERGEEILGAINIPYEYKTF